MKTAYRVPTRACDPWPSGGGGEGDRVGSATVGVVVSWGGWTEDEGGGVELKVGAIGDAADIIVDDRRRLEGWRHTGSGQ
jgi:hypothetical protein